MLEIKRLDARPGEVLVPCGVLNVPTPLTLQNPKTGYSRSIVAVEGNLSLLEWRDPAGPCSEGD